MDSTSNAMRNLRAEVESVMHTQARAEGVDDDETMAALSERVAAIVAARLQELEAERRVAEEDIRDRNQVRAITGLASLVLGIPTTAILWHSDGPAAAAFTWIAILLVNIVVFIRARPPGLAD
jgi:hypothetical protein